MYEGREFTELPLDGMRKTIAARLTEAKQNIPHFYLRREVRLDALVAFREQMKARGMSDRGGPNAEGGGAPTDGGKRDGGKYSRGGETSSAAPTAGAAPTNNKDDKRSRGGK